MGCVAGSFLTHSPCFLPAFLPPNRVVDWVFDWKPAWGCGFWTEQARLRVKSTLGDSEREATDWTGATRWTEPGRWLDARTTDGELQAAAAAARGVRTANEHQSMVRVRASDSMEVMGSTELKKTQAPFNQLFRPPKSGFSLHTRPRNGKCGQRSGFPCGLHHNPSWYRVWSISGSLRISFSANCFGNHRRGLHTTPAPSPLKPPSLAFTMGYPA